MLVIKEHMEKIVTWWPGRKAVRFYSRTQYMTLKEKNSNSVLCYAEQQ